MPAYPIFDADITVFPPEFVDVITGIAGAAEEAGIDAAIDLDAIEADRDLAMLAGAIRTLAEDEIFLAYIANNLGTEEEVVEEETIVEEPLPGGGEEVIEDEELFMQRM